MIGADIHLARPNTERLKIALPNCFGWQLLCALLLTACTGSTTPVLDDIQETGKLIVLTRNGPTTYYEGRDGPDGFEYSLASELAADLGVELEIRLADSLSELLRQLAAGEAHMGAAGLTITEERRNSFRFGPEYRQVQQQVLCHRKGTVPDNPGELAGLKLNVHHGSSYVASLEALKLDLPELAWSTTTELSTDQLLEQVSQRELDCTVADSNIAAINRRYFPELVVAFPVSEEEPLAWALPGTAAGFEEHLINWFERIEGDGTLNRINERFYGHVDVFDYVDLRTYSKRIQSRLPNYRSQFEAAAEKHKLSWTLLAAQAYQESHWNPKAKSPTGVRGMMMLTLPTAKELGVRNRLDPAQSIEGGARYLANLKKRLPDDITGEDRLWFALAAYNIGMGHIYDALKLARQMVDQPTHWNDFKRILPLLSQKQYYRELKYGYARGTEPVRYVQRVRDFRDILEQSLTQ